MRDGPSIARVAALIGDAARAEILASLMGGQALTATELASLAGIAKQTASAHLAKLPDARLVEVASQGRHRYFRLADDDVARVLETLMGLSACLGAARLRTGPRQPALREARVCYDHLAGEQGVRLLDGLVGRRLLRPSGIALGATAGTAPGDARSRSELQLTPAGTEFFERFGIDLAGLTAGRRPLCRHCLDWSVRRHHLAGALGAALLQRFYTLGWARRLRGSRAVAITPLGEAGLRRQFFVG